jgi:hypothetical protein
LAASPEFSVIVPTRGDAPHLRAALASVLSAGASLEVLLVHHRAPGDRPLPDALREDTRVRVLEIAVDGPSAARNAGIDAARGRLLAFLDDDDVWLQGHLERAGRTLDARRELVLYACDAHLLRDPSPDGSAALPDDAGRLPRHGAAGSARDLSLRELLLANPILTSTVVLARERLGPGDRFRVERPVMEDYELWLRLARDRALRWEPRPGAIIRKRRGSASGDLRRMAAEAIEILTPLLEPGSRPPLSPAEARRRLGRLWHELAYACLVEGDGPGARAAAAAAAARLPLSVKNYMYLLTAALPRGARRALLAHARAAAGGRER